MKRCLFLSVALILSLTLPAQWTSNAQLNTAVSTGPGSQTSRLMFTDGNGNVFFLITDYRSAPDLPDLFLQKLDQNGNPVFPAPGKPITTDLGKKEYPDMIPDGAGGVYVCWKDYRNDAGVGNADIYAQRLNANGDPLWNNAGVAVCTATGIQHLPKLIPAASGVLVTWIDNRVALTPAQYAQRINDSGTMMWNANGNLVFNNSGSSFENVCSDGNSGAVFCYSINNGTTMGYDLFAQRIDGNGNILWAGGRTINADPGDQIYPYMVPDGTGGTIVSFKYTNSNPVAYGIHSARINGTGTKSWEVTVASDAITRVALKAASDRNNGVYLCWEDYRDSPFGKTYGQHIDQSGTILWTAGGLKISDRDVFNSQTNPDITADLTGNAVVVWEDRMLMNADPGKNVYAMKIAPNGTLSWIPGGVIVCNETTSDQTFPFVRNDDNCGIIVSWYDQRNGNNDVYAQHLDCSGSSINALPVQLLSFEGFPENGRNRLTWITTQEINSAEFILEKSVDGIRFITDQSLPAAGFSQSSRTYQLFDLMPDKRINYYRLKQVDRDGRFSYSRVVTVRNALASGIYMHPNPATTYTDLRILGREHADLRWQLMDEQGRVWQQSTHQQISASFQQRIVLKGMIAGTYFLCMWIDGERIVQPVILMK